MIRSLKGRKGLCFAAGRLPLLISASLRGCLLMKSRKELEIAVGKTSVHPLRCRKKFHSATSRNPMHTSAFLGEGVLVLHRNKHSSAMGRESPCVHLVQKEYHSHLLYPCGNCDLDQVWQQEVTYPCLEVVRQLRDREQIV